MNSSDKYRRASPLPPILAAALLLLLSSLHEGNALAGNENMPGMVQVPAGKFIFGDKDEGTQETIELRAFFIDRFEVTNEDYKKVKRDHAYPPGKGKHPAVNVSWREADSFCKALGKRLPTEEEWEKAARGADGRLYPWGNEFDKARANTREGGSALVASHQHGHGTVKNPETGGTVPVGSYEAGKSPYGVHDMAGNVREWAGNWYDENKIYKPVRGGSFIDDEEGVLAFSVKKSIPEDAKEYVGFRCAK